jgi:hypothetical protein
MAGPAARNSSEISIAQQYGVSFLPLMVMERDKLVENMPGRRALATSRTG